MKTVLILAAAMCCLAAHLRADVTITSETTIGAMGMSMGGGVVKSYVSGDKSRMESVSEAMPAMQFSANTPAKSYNITRLDKGVTWTIYDIDSTFAETELSLVKEMMADTQPTGGDPRLDSLAGAWQITSESLGDSTINGFSCRGSRLQGDIEIKGETIRFICAFWAAESYPGIEELRAFEQKSSEVSDVKPFSNAQMLAQLIQSMGMPVDSLESYIDNIEGLLVSTSLKLYMSMDFGALNTPAAPDTLPPASPFADEKPEQSLEAALNEAQADDSLMNQAMAQMMAAMEANSRDGMTETMSMTVEIKAIESGPVDPALFEIPAAYREF